MASRSTATSLSPKRVAELLILRQDRPRLLHASLNEVMSNLERVNVLGGRISREFLLPQPL